MYFLGKLIYCLILFTIIHNSKITSCAEGSEESKEEPFIHYDQAIIETSITNSDKNLETGKCDTIRYPHCRIIYFLAKN